MDLTVLELHFHDAEFTAPFAGGRSSADDEPSEGPERARDAAEASSKLGPFAALLGLVGLALLARYLRGGEAERTVEDEVEA